MIQPVFFVMGLIGLFLSLIVTPLVGRYMKSIGKVGKDVHKKNQPEIPESGGIGYMFIFLLIVIIGVFIAPSDGVQGKFMISLIILIIVTIVGLYDDFRDLSPTIKPLLLVIASLPVILVRTWGDEVITQPFPALPFVGNARLTIVYWILAVFVIAIPANASNMLDVMNGVMSFSGILVMLTAFVASFIVNIPEDAVFYVRFMSLAMVGVLLGFWWFNKYPATIFAGDTGSLGVGATIGLIAVYGQLEFVMVVALLVHIMNSFSIISSVRGLRERKEMVRPVIVEDGRIHATKNPLAPITLVRLIVAREPMEEKDVVSRILILVLYCCGLALISAYLLRTRLVIV